MAMTGALDILEQRELRSRRWLPLWTLLVIVLHLWALGEAPWLLTERHWRPPTAKTSHQKATIPKLRRLEQITAGSKTNKPTKINWIGAQDYQQFMAEHQAKFDQPSFQTQVQPDPHARQDPYKPTDPQSGGTPAMAAASAAPPSRTDAKVHAQAGMPTMTPSPTGSPIAMQPAPRTDAQPAPKNQPHDKPSQPTPPAPASNTHAVTAAPAGRPGTGHRPVDDPQPTAAPHRDFQTPSVVQIPSAEFQAGRVNTVRGIRIKPAIPLFDGAALAYGIPARVKVTVTFNTNGTVKSAKLLTPTGQMFIDSPIENSLWRWRAAGGELDQGKRARVLNATLYFR